MKADQAVLVCAATVDELRRFGLDRAETMEPGRLWKIPQGHAAVTGVGTPATLIRIAPWLESLRPGLLVNLGIAGAYSGSGLEIGDVAAGISECFADLGMELPEAEAFRPIAEFPFADALGHDPIALWTPDWIAESDAPVRVRRGRGATVNTCTGRAETGARRRRIFNADFESMEGAAVALAGLARGVPVLEIRAISNVAADRDLQPENVTRALESLRRFWETHRDRLS